MLMGTHSLAAYLQLQVVWGYIEILPRAFYPSRHALMLLSAHDESSSMSALCLRSTTPTKLKR
ncbi:hypothetical protein FXE65_12950 [Vibrio cholerae]|nr:hypothetical protein FXE65_12950 [Vibrio cholerae]